MSRFTNLLKHAGELAPQTKQMLKGWAEELKALQANPAGNEAKIQVLSDRIKNTTEANVPREAPMQGPERLRTTNQPAITKSDSGNILIPGEGKSAADLLQESQPNMVKAGDVLKEGFQDPLQRDLKRLNDYEEMLKTKKSTIDALKPEPKMRSSEDMKKLAAGFVADSPFAKADPLTALNQATENTGRNLVNRFLPDSSPEDKALAQKTFETVANPMNLIGGAGLADLAMGAVEIAPEAYEAGKARFKSLFGK